jgi:[acyl-carrier-protein] S-malonyltransferase
MSSFAVLCSGQGGRAPDLFERFPFTEKGRSVKQQILDSGCLSPEVTEWLKDPRTHPSLIYQDHYAQPLLCLFQAMVWAELSERLPTPQFVAGYSLGELSAYGCAGALAPKDTIGLATARAHFMDSAAPVGSLIAVSGLAVEKAAEIAARHQGYVAIIVRSDHCLLGCLAEKAEALASAAALSARKVVILTPLGSDFVSAGRVKLPGCPRAWLRSPTCPYGPSRRDCQGGPFDQRISNR